MKNTEHAQLLDQLALALAEYDSANPYHDAAPLVARARQAAEEIEGRREPSDEELLALAAAELGYSEIPDDDEDCVIAYRAELIDYGRAVLARFGGGEEV